MRISYDPAKDERNRRNHGYPLLLAARLFTSGGWIDFADDRRLGYEHEARRIALGEVDGQVVVCVFTEQDDGDELVRRIISWRDATRDEACVFH